MENLLILGAGGHGKVVAEAAELEMKYNKISFLDDREDVKRVLNFDIIGKLNDYDKFLDNYKYAFVAIGNNKKRLELIDKLIKAGFKVPKIIHSKASVSKYSNIDLGSIILANAVVNVNVTIGKGCIININSTIDHDCKISDGVHISSGAVIRSMVKVGELSTVGAAACVKSGSIVKEKCFLEEGSVFKKILKGE
ncbi:acetyltransferase [Clostridium carnis]